MIGEARWYCFVWHEGRQFAFSWHQHQQESLAVTSTIRIIFFLFLSCVENIRNNVRIF